MFARFLEKLATFVFDVAAVNVAFLVAVWIRYLSGWFPETFRSDMSLMSQIGQFRFQLLVLTGCWLVLFFFAGLYRDWYKESRIDEFFAVLKTIVVGMFLVFLVTGAPQILEFAQTGNPAVLFTRTKLVTLLTYGGSMLFFATVNRFLMHTLLAFLLTKGIGRHNTLIIGANESGLKLLDELRHYPHMGHRVVGFIDNDGLRAGASAGGLPVMGTYSDLPNVARRERVESIILQRCQIRPMRSHASSRASAKSASPCTWFRR